VTICNGRQQAFVEWISIYANQTVIYNAGTVLTDFP